MTNNFDNLSQYFFLKKRIARTYERIRYFEEKFITSNFYTCIQERDEDVTTVAFNIEREVVNYVTAVQQAERHIRIMEYKHRHFTRFVQELPFSEREYLLSRYKYNEEVLNERLDRLLTDEVAEIEEAVRYRFDLELPLQKQLDSISTENHFENMMDLLEV